MKRKSFLAVVTALLLALSLVPSVALAAGTECDAGLDCTDHVAAIGSVHYDSLQAAIDDAQSGAEIVLLQTFVENSVRFNKSGTYTLNLNENALVSNKAGSDIIGIFGADLTLKICNGMLVTEDTTTYGIYSYTGANNLNLELDNVFINCIDQALGVQGNNNTQNVTVKSSIINCETTGIYFPPKSGKLVIDNSVVSAENNAVVVKGGSVEVKGEDTMLIATGTPEEQDKPYDGNTAGEGFPKTGSALYVEGGYTADDGGQRPIDVVLLDGLFLSENAAAVAVNHIKDPGVQTTVVKGGVYSSDVAQFVADGVSYAVVSADGEEGVLCFAGTSEVVAARIPEILEAGCRINVMKGDVDLVVDMDDITVVNSGTGKVTVDGQAVENGKEYETHAHDWKVVGAKEPTCTAEGYTGDKVCSICNAKVAGTVLEKLAHNYVDGKCTVCGAADPSVAPATGDASQPLVWTLAALLSCAGVVLLVKLNKERRA